MVIPDGFAQVNFIFSGDAAPTGAEVTMGFNITSFVGGPLDLATAATTHWDDSGLVETYTGSCTLAEVRAKFGPDDTGPFASVFPALAGTAANPSVTVNTALLIQKQTLSGGRTGRGRFFMPGVPDNQAAADGAVNPGFISTAFGDWNDWLGKMNTDDAIVTLLHGPGSPHPTPISIEALVPQPKLATQRRRLRR